MAEFVWTDLSTYDTAAAQRFYHAVLGWSFEADGTDYTAGTTAGWHAAGLYPMPDFFRKINMPSFWMSYIKVENIDRTVALANELGAKIELQDENSFGRFALIRDPLGAGFTCIQNDAMPSARGTEPGMCCWNELVISDPSKARPFYTRLFGWSFEPRPGDRDTIRNAYGQPIASLQAAPNEIKGDKEYWAVSFAVADLGAARRAVERAGGSIVYDYANELGQHLVARDDQGATFTLTAMASPPTNDTGLGTTPAKPGTTPTQHQVLSLKWRALVGLFGVYLIVLFQQDWAWGLLLLFWVLPDLKTGVTYFIEPVERRHNPITYWAIVLTWLGLSAYALIAALL